MLIAKEQGISNIDSQKDTANLITLFSKVKMSVTVKPGITAVFNNLGHKRRLIGTQKFWVIQYKIYCWWQCKEFATYIILYKPGHLNSIICFVVIPSNCIAIF